MVLCQSKAPLPKTVWNFILHSNCNFFYPKWAAVRNKVDWDFVVSYSNDCKVRIIYFRDKIGWKTGLAEERKKIWASNLGTFLDWDAWRDKRKGGLCCTHTVSNSSKMCNNCWDFGKTSFDFFLENGSNPCFWLNSYFDRALSTAV